MPTGSGDHLVVEGHRDPAQITRLLAAQDLYVHELTAVRPTLESFFLKLTGQPQRPADTATGDDGEAS